MQRTCFTLLILLASGSPGCDQSKASSGEPPASSNLAASTAKPDEATKPDEAAAADEFETPKAPEEPASLLPDDLCESLAHLPVDKLSSEELVRKVRATKPEQSPVKPATESAGCDWHSPTDNRMVFSVSAYGVDDEIMRPDLIKRSERFADQALPVGFGGTLTMREGESSVNGTMTYGGRGIAYQVSYNVKDMDPLPTRDELVELAAAVLSLGRRR